jgi:methionyl-tRNA formyltransferase
MEVLQIHNFIRGLSPYPCAKTFLKNELRTNSLRIFESLPESDMHTLQPGHIISDGKHFLKIACKNGFINVISLQLGGKSRMSTAEFLRGFKISDYPAVVSQPV